MILKPIILPARSGAKLVFRLVDSLQSASLWVEVKRSLDDAGARFDAVLTDAVNAQWTVSIPSSFSSVNRGEKWFAVVCIPGEDAPDELGALPITFGIDTDYEPAQYAFSRTVQGEIVIQIERITLQDFDAPDYLFYYNLAKQI